MNVGPTVDEILDSTLATIDDLVERRMMAELVDGFFELFRVPIRVIGERASVLVTAGREPELYEYLRQFAPVGRSVDDTVARVIALVPNPTESPLVHCCSGAAYRVLPVGFEGRRVGRVVLGPYLPTTVKTIPGDLLSLDATMDASEVKRLLASLPRAKDETVSQIGRHLCKSLELILFSGHKASVTNEMHTLSIHENHRELSEKNSQLESAVARLEELDRLKSNFLATISHELRTPLTSIIGYSEMLKEGLAGPLLPEQLEYVATIFGKGNRLLELIMGLLDLSKMESGQLQLHRGSVDVARLVGEVIETLRPAARSAGVELEPKVEIGLDPLAGDPARLRQILLNLADNAVKFTPEGGRVTISARRGTKEQTEEGGMAMVLFAAPSATVEFSVTDTGIGIADEDKQRVFDPFFQADSGTTRQTPGSGLGLAIVRRLVAAHEGKVWVENNSPRGAKFVVSIPTQALSS